MAAAANGTYETPRQVIYGRGSTHSQDEAALFSYYYYFFFQYRYIGVCNSLCEYREVVIAEGDELHRGRRHGYRQQTHREPFLVGEEGGKEDIRKWGKYEERDIRIGLDSIGAGDITMPFGYVSLKTQSDHFRQDH